MMSAPYKKVLFVLSSHRRLGKTSLKTGYWLEEVAAPYEILSARGIEVVFASPKGGAVPVDPESLLPQNLTFYTENFCLNQEAQEKLAQTYVLRNLNPEDFDGVFYAGNYGTFFDLMQNPVSIHFLEVTLDAGKPVAFIGHSIAALKYVQDRKEVPVLKGRFVTGFRDSEEAGLILARMFAFVPRRILRFWRFVTYLVACLPSPEYASLLRLNGAIPFLVQRMLKREGSIFKCKRNWHPFLMEDLTEEGGHLITGQNPASASLLGDRLAEILLSDRHMK
ncbi:type 1 glutamine amidotransferase domain-containing protein [Acetobacteraceae bacterium]|nr:type 1 glutamine amidotransferase domain-containing protein [Acetobacteraceae bacterium]